MHSYRVPGKVAEARVVEKKSEFIARIAPAETEAAALAVLEDVRRQHRTASHNVYAYVLREGARQRYSDDGEPAKTAGLPVLGAITHAGLCDTIIVVTRYFGGTLLGTGGLVRAYAAAAKAAVEAAGVSRILQCTAVSLTVDYTLYEPLRRLIEAAGARLDEPVFADKVSLCCTLPTADAPALCAALEEAVRGGVPIRQSRPFYTPFEQGGTA